MCLFMQTFPDAKLISIPKPTPIFAFCYKDPDLRSTIFHWYRLDPDTGYGMSAFFRSSIIQWTQSFHSSTPANPICQASHYTFLHKYNKKKKLTLSSVNGNELPLKYTA